MTREQAISEASRRSKIKVTADGRNERIYVCYYGHDEFRVHRWVDIPMGTRLTACFLNGNEQPQFQPETRI